MYDSKIRVGAVLHGYCGGCFGDSYGDKRVEAIGSDWVVAREEGSNRKPVFFSGDLREIEEYLDPASDLHRED